MKKLLILIVLVTSTSSFAWGSHEQGALLGFVIGSGIVLQQQQPQTNVYIQQNTPYPTQYAAPYGIQPRTLTCGVQIQCVPAPRFCQNIPLYTSLGEYAGYQRICQ